MKYAVLTYAKRPMRAGRKTVLNIGDPIQTCAMRHIYHQMGVEDKDLIEISRYHTKDYSGEQVLLPFNAFNMIYNQFGYPYGTLPVSSDIIPVFISFHLHSTEFDNAIIDNLKAYQPIGCRDEETLLNMKNHGIQAYLSGCATALFPRRKSSPGKPKIFLADIPESLTEYIPEEIKLNAEYVKHQIEFNRLSDSDFMTEEEYRQFYQTGVNQLDRYRKEATLVVTSRLHAAAPCMAMGIPVILVSDNFDGRFSWIDKYLTLYTPDKFKEIVWNPEAVDYEEDKRAITEIFIREIQRRFEQVKDSQWLNDYYGLRTRSMINSELVKGLKELPFARNKRIRYGIWGLIAQAQTIKNVIENHFEDWRLETIIDKAAAGTFEGREVKKPEDIAGQDADIIYFILPVAAHEDAKILLTKLGRKFVLVNKYRLEFYG